MSGTSIWSFKHLMMRVKSFRNKFFRALPLVRVSLNILNIDLEWLFSWNSCITKHDIVLKHLDGCYWDRRLKSKWFVEAHANKVELICLIHRIILVKIIELFQSGHEISHKFFLQIRLLDHVVNKIRSCNLCSGTTCKEESKHFINDTFVVIFEQFVSY